MATQLGYGEKPRCQRHGLSVGHNGACPLCSASSRSATRGRVVSVVAVGVLAASAIAVAVGGHVAQSPSSAATTQASAASAGPKRRAGLDFSRGLRVPVARGVVDVEPRGASPLIPEREQSDLEDRHLGHAVVQPATAPVAPPTPPRAPVDPEPEALDDPHDFELGQDSARGP